MLEARAKSALLTPGPTDFPLMAGNGCFGVVFASSNCTDHTNLIMAECEASVGTLNLPLVCVLVVLGQIECDIDIHESLSLERGFMFLCKEY